MIELFSDTDRTLYYEGCRYQEITPEETRALPEDTEVYVAELQDGRINEVSRYVTGLRFKRPVLYKEPFRNIFVNIGSFSTRMYLQKA